MADVWTVQNMFKQLEAFLGVIFVPTKLWKIWFVVSWLFEASGMVALGQVPWVLGPIQQGGRGLFTHQAQEA